MNLNLKYNARQKRKSSFLLSLAQKEFEAAQVLIEGDLYRESITHIYFSCYYSSQALLVHEIKRASHKGVDRALHRTYGREKEFPRSYIDLHSFLHECRNRSQYGDTDAPPPKLINQKMGRLEKYIRFTYKNLPKVSILDIMREICVINEHIIEDISYDIYCPKTYSHHTRLTFWHPTFYLDIFSPDKVCEKAKIMLSSLHVRKSGDYALGFNSRLNQYKPIHLIMLDFDTTIDSSVEESLRKIGGMLLKSGRGFHFISWYPIVGQSKWERKMKSLSRDKVLKKYIDKDHIEISLQRGYSTLRVTASPDKSFAPIFFKEI